MTTYTTLTRLAIQRQEDFDNALDEFLNKFELTHSTKVSNEDKAWMRDCLVTDLSALTGVPEMEIYPYLVEAEVIDNVVVAPQFRGYECEYARFDEVMAKFAHLIERDIE